MRYEEPYASEIWSIRSDVFTNEQQIDHDLDFDGLDGDAIHVLVAFREAFVGTGRMLADGHVGRLAVLREYRGRGLGARAVLALVREAKKNGLGRVYLGAQRPAIGFYRKLGFSEYGESYTEANIEHVHMERSV